MSSTDFDYINTKRFGSDKLELLNRRCPPLAPSSCRVASSSEQSDLTMRFLRRTPIILQRCPYISVGIPPSHRVQEHVVRNHVGASGLRVEGPSRLRICQGGVEVKEFRD